MIDLPAPSLHPEQSAQQTLAELERQCAEAETAFRTASLRSPDLLDAWDRLHSIRRLVTGHCKGHGLWSPHAYEGGL